MVKALRQCPDPKEPPTRRRRGFDMAGNDWTDEYRLRPGLFGAVLEQLVINSDGAQRWKRARWPVSISTFNR